VTRLFQAERAAASFPFAVSIPFGAVPKVRHKPSAIADTIEKFSQASFNLVNISGFDLIA
jgi:hypothetical protein